MLTNLFREVTCQCHILWYEILMYPAQPSLPPLVDKLDPTSAKSTIHRRKYIKILRNLTPVNAVICMAEKWSNQDIIETSVYLKSATSTSACTIIRDTNNCPWIRCIPMKVNNLIPEYIRKQFIGIECFTICLNITSQYWEMEQY